jgi:S1-C subfamily serine protease
LGIGIQPLTPEIANALGLRPHADGVVVNAVAEDSAAEAAGLVPGDVITAIDGEKMDDVEQLRRTVAMKGASRAIDVVVSREGRTRHLRATLDALPGQETAPSQPLPPDDSSSAVVGLVTAPLDDTMRARFRLSTEVHGLVVTDVQPGSRAELAGLRPGHLILEANQQSLMSHDDLRSAFAQSEQVLLLVQRGATRGYVVIES